MQEVQSSILPTGTIVQERYVIENLLGRGGFGAVYLVRDLRVRGNLFALKEIVDTSKQERERFAFECEVLKRLDHHSLPRVYRVFEDDKNARAYMLMDYIEGPNLEMLRLQQPDKRFPLEQALDMIAPIFDVVSYFHKQEPPIIHRDIKPSNIIVPKTGDEAVLVDFGIAKEYNMDATTTAVRRCSPGYGAPEQYARGTNPRTDIYGLAATLYAILTGVVPIDAFYRMTQIGGKNHDPLEPVIQQVPSIPQSVSDAIQKAMAINSADRFASIEEFWQALNAYRGYQSVPAPIVGSAPDPLAAPRPEAALAAIEQEPVTIVTRPVNGNKRRGAFILLFASLTLIALVGGLIFGNGLLTSNRHNQPPVSATSVPGKKVTAAPTPKSTTIPTSAPTATPTSQPTTPAATPTPTATQVPPTASPAPAGSPTLAGSYNGTITDQLTTPPTDGTLNLTGISQNNPNIKGYAAIGGALQGSGNFSGQVLSGGAIWFLVTGYQGNAPLYFSGQVQSNGNMAGSYCSYVNKHCDYNVGGHGTWNVTPAQAAASS